jgi:hypothetical protein
VKPSGDGGERTPEGPTQKWERLNGSGQKLQAMPYRFVAEPLNGRPSLAEVRIAALQATTPPPGS